jgi:hypothetical protein
VQVDAEEDGMDVEAWKEYFGKFCVFQLEWASEIASKVKGRKVSEIFNHSNSLSS